MPGLYSFRKTPDETRNLFDFLEKPEFPPRPYVAPGGPMAVVRMEQGARHFALVHWGFIPSWAKEVKPFKNARAETVIEKPSFRNAMKRRRCLIPADGFYEWKGEPRKKQAFFFHRPDNGLLAFGGLWENWMATNGSEIETGLIITTEPNLEVSAIHPRMPVVIAPQDFEIWLNGEVQDAAPLMRPAPDGYFVAEPTRIERNSSPPKPPDQPRLL
jgi:putative SOS response-associated peptidase YedK